MFSNNWQEKSSQHINAHSFSSLKSKREEDGRDSTIKTTKRSSESLLINNDFVFRFVYYLCILSLKNMPIIT